MKLTFNYPNDNHSLYANDLLKYGLLYDNIFIGESNRNHKEFTIDWNDVYHHWDISLFPILGNAGNPTKQFKQFEEWLDKNGYRYDKSKTFTWFNHECYDGVRFFIYPKQ